MPSAASHTAQHLTGSGCCMRWSREGWQVCLLESHCNVQHGSWVPPRASGTSRPSTALRGVAGPCVCACMPAPRACCPFDVCCTCQPFRSSFAHTRLSAARMLAFVAERAGAINRLVLMNSEGYWSGMGVPWSGQRFNCMMQCTRQILCLRCTVWYRQQQS